MRLESYEQPTENVGKDNDEERSVFARPKPYILPMTRVQASVIMRAL
jgi:hypothetical protein